MLDVDRRRDMGYGRVQSSGHATLRVKRSIIYHIISYHMAGLMLWIGEPRTEQPINPWILDDLLITISSRDQGLYAYKYIPIYLYIKHIYKNGFFGTRTASASASESEAESSEHFEASTHSLSHAFSFVLMNPASTKTKAKKTNQNTKTQPLITSPRPLHPPKTEQI